MLLLRGLGFLVVLIGLALAAISGVIGGMLLHTGSIREEGSSVLGLRESASFFGWVIGAGGVIPGVLLLLLGARMQTRRSRPDPPEAGP